MKLIVQYERVSPLWIPGLTLLILLLVVSSALRAQGSDLVDNARKGLYSSTWPYGRSDDWRTGAATGAGLPAGFENAPLVAQSLTLPSTPYWGVTYSDEVMFVLGGQSFFLKPFSFATADDTDLVSPNLLFTEGVKAASVQPYVAAIDPRSMSIINIADLPRSPGQTKLTGSDLRFLLDGSNQLPSSGSAQSLNYPGNILIHENGKIYAVATSTLYELDPVSMEVSRTLDLPRFALLPVGTVYNGIAVAPLTGDLIVKGFNLFTSAPPVNAPARLLAVDPETLQIRMQTVVPRVGATRLTTAAHDGTQYVYATNATETVRIVIGETNFQVDEAWLEAYRTPGDGTTDAVSMTYMGGADFVVFQNNNSVIAGVTAPLRLFTKQTDTTSPTLMEFDANSTLLPGGSWASFAADPFNTGMIVTNDAINSVFTAWRWEQSGLMKVWESDIYRSRSGTAIAVDQEHLYIDDRRCLGGNCRLFLVVLDLSTGIQLADVEVAGSSPSVGQIVLDKDSVFYIAMEPDKRHGYITKISVE